MRMSRMLIVFLTVAFCIGGCAEVKKQGSSEAATRDTEVTTSSFDGTNKLVIRASQKEETINPDIYGHFAEHLGRCVYEGFWVGEESDIPNVRGIRTDVVEALKELNIPVLRWPGGCFADEYHWKEGIGPRSERSKMVNTHWGMVTETNAFGTHEFLDL
ncbi:MAG: hypothetical protein JW912_04670, partial [Sedimentisphaerales bacterium]|nr:hypothetical protein [Sedimentisphaerales bacterium]